MQVCQLKISWNKLAPRTQPRDRGVQDFYIITTSFMTFHETVFCERMGSQNLSNRLFYQHDFVREIARTTSRRDREMYKRDDWMNSDVTEVRLTIRRQSAYAQDSCALTITRKCIIMRSNVYNCTQILIACQCVRTKTCKELLAYYHELAQYRWNNQMDRLNWFEL